jgi:hypothetical protein
MLSFQTFNLQLKRFSFGQVSHAFFLQLILTAKTLLLARIRSRRAHIKPMVA